MKERERRRTGKERRAAKNETSSCAVQPGGLGMIRYFFAGVFGYLSST